MLAEPQTKIGGIGCKHCMYWQKIEDPELKESLALNGEWGRCTNSTVLKKAYDLRDSVKTAREREHTYTKVMLGSAIYFTSHSFLCPQVRVAKEGNK